MNKYAVLTCKKQPLTAEQQLAFSKQLGIIEHVIGATLREDKDARLPSTFADVSKTLTRRIDLLISTTDRAYLR